MFKLRTTICRSGWLYLFVLLFIVGGAVIREINLLMFVAGIMLGPWLLSWRQVGRSVQRVTVERVVPRSIGVGDVLDVTLTLHNRRRRLGAWGLVAQDRITRIRPGRQDDSMTVQVLFPWVAAGERVSSGYEGRLYDRGEYRFGPLLLISRFPLGLMQRAVQHHLTGRLMVFPRLGRLTRRWTDVVQPMRAGTQRSMHRHGPREGEFHSLRDWRSGDSRRWIHWRTSARRNQLTVRQFELRQNQDLALLVELREVNGGQATCEATELAIRFAATVVAHHCRRGSSRLLLGIAGRSVDFVSGVASRALMQDAMERLAISEASRTDRLDELVHQTFDEIPAETRVVLVSTCPVNVDDTERLATVWSDLRKRSRLSRILCINAASADLAAYYEDCPA
jgi:uncharacterized protein (DUF58 family)